MNMTGKRVVLICFLICFTVNVFAQSDKPLAVVELFTSEGCSSCPAADVLLRDMAELCDKEGKPFIALAFHVTYWNHLGWTDPYSLEAYTQRQKNYVYGLKFPHVYTPQAIVNGAHEFVGSNAVAFRDTLSKAERRKFNYTIEALASLKGDSIEVQYKLNKDSKNFVLNIAIVEKSSVREVTRGENKSKTLRHFNVVRQFKTLELKEQGVVMLKNVDNLPITNSEVVLFVQQKKLLRIVGATKIPITALN